MNKYIILAFFVSLTSSLIAQERDSLSKSRHPWEFSIDAQYLIAKVKYPNQDAKDLRKNKVGDRISLGLNLQKQVLQNVIWSSNLAIGHYSQDVNFLRSSNSKISGSFLTDASREGFINFSELFLSLSTHFRVNYVKKPNIFVEPGLVIDRVISKTANWTYQLTTFYDVEQDLFFDPPRVETVTERFSGKRWRYGFSLGMGTTFPLGKHLIIPSIRYQFIPFDLGFDNRIEQHTFGLNCKFLLTNSEK